MNIRCSLIQSLVVGGVALLLVSCTNPIDDGEESSALRFQSVAAGRAHTCALDQEGRVFCWGDNSFGQLGTGDTTSSRVPIRVAGDFGFTSILAGDLRTCGVTANRGTYCWGNPERGGSVPVRPASDPGFASLALGDLHACGLTAGGAALCWGRGALGQLGTGSPTISETPVPVVGGLTFSVISAGGKNTCGVATGGAGYCWGETNIGTANPPQELCLTTRGGSYYCTPRPTPVAGGLVFRTISVGVNGSCGIAVDGSAHCWGSNGQQGRLGNNSTTSSPTPVPVLGGHTFRSVNIGQFHACGVTAAGVAVCWGGNSSGELGNGTMFDSRVPVHVTGGQRHTYVSVAPFAFLDPVPDIMGHSCGVTDAGAVFCWGDNTVGQLGDGTVESRSVPRQVTFP